MFINTFIASNDHIRKIICFIVTCSVIHCHLVKAHVQLKVAHFVTYLCVLATTMTTPLLGMTTKMGLSPTQYVLSSYRKPEPSISSTSSRGNCKSRLDSVLVCWTNTHWLCNQYWLPYSNTDTKFHNVHSI